MDIISYSQIKKIKQDYAVIMPVNLIKNVTWATGYWNAGSGLNTGLTNIRASSVIAIKPNTYYKMIGLSASISNSVILFNDNDDFIASILYSTTSNGVFKTPNGSFTCARVNVLATDIATSSLKECSSDGTLTISGGDVMREYVGGVFSRFYGKKANFKGDSITYGSYTPLGHGSPDGVVTNKYCDIVGANLGLSLVRNYAVSGISISSTSSINPSLAIAATYNSMDNDADLIVIAGGTNDYGTNVVLGTIADTTDVSFYGALDVLCNGLITKYQGKKIVFISPIHRLAEYANSVGCTLAQYKTAISEVCKKYGIPVIDGFDLGITCANSTVKDAYINDGLHPNEEGHKLFAANLTPRLNNV